MSPVPRDWLILAVHRCRQGRTEGRAAAWAVGETSAAAQDPDTLRQQGEVGGDVSGGRPQDGGVPRQPERWELRAGHHEHCEFSRFFPSWS